MTALVTRDDEATAIEQVIMGGDLAALSPAQRLNYYSRVCESVGLNALTRPFEYLRLNGKLVLYARKDATDQLRSLRGVSIGKPDIQFEDGLVVVSVLATDKTGRTDSEIGAVAIEGLKGEARANALMKSITKAKRRVTLSICGLGMLDETEVITIGGAQPVEINHETGEILPGPISPADWLAYSAPPEQTPSLDDLRRLGGPVPDAAIPPTPDALAQYARGIKAVREANLDEARWELPSGATGEDVDAAIRGMAAALKAAKV